MLIGTCGNCGGPVEVPDIWMGIYRPTPTCRVCGAVPERAFGPVIPMRNKSGGYKYGQGRLEGKIRTRSPFSPADQDDASTEGWISRASHWCSYRPN